MTLGPEMAPYYRIVTSTGALSADQAVFEAMEKENKEELEKLDGRLAEAEKTEGESEISDALKARANYFTRIGDKVRGCSDYSLIIHLYFISYLGSSSDSPETCPGKDSGSWLSDRHRANPRPDRLFLWRPRTHHFATQAG
jgi:26S proteasome subunit RPN7